MIFVKNIGIWAYFLMLNIISTKKLHITYEVKIIAIHLFRLFHELIAKSMSVSNGTATFSFLVYGAYYIKDDAYIVIFHTAFIYINLC